MTGWHVWTERHREPWPENPEHLRDMLTRNPATCVLQPREGEDLMEFLHRTAPIVRNALGFEPAPDMGNAEWLDLLRRTHGVRQDAGHSSSSGGRRR